MFLHVSFTAQLEHTMRLLLMFNSFRWTRSPIAAGRAFSWLLPNRQLRRKWQLTKTQDRDVADFEQCSGEAGV